MSDGMLTEDDFLQHMDDTISGMDESEFLEHYGKKGMKWGQRLAEASLGVAADARSTLNSGGDRNTAIDAARGRRKSGENKTNLKEAKAVLKASRKTEGEAAAKAALRAVRDKNADDFHDARLAKSGKEAVAVALLATAAIAMQIAAARS